MSEVYINRSWIDILKIEKLVSEGKLIEDYIEREPRKDCGCGGEGSGICTIEGKKDRILYFVNGSVTPVAYIYEKYVLTAPCEGERVLKYRVDGRFREKLKSVEFTNEDLIDGLNKLFANKSIKSYEIKQIF